MYMIVDMNKLSIDSSPCLPSMEGMKLMILRLSNSNEDIRGTITDGGDQKGKKTEPPKNLMAERHRRKKLNDRLYMMRSVVPKIRKLSGDVEVNYEGHDYGSFYREAVQVF
ncbi:hypothetical protein IFM89_006862 [Coptis chinensis]|uniref:BHLH domain-containing protein n=1 Tax=Coptis chinensis TaxID=261450 RepID=A0A835GZG5_9MAGN|nr:hypothetical protein IFM89_006862 [Coptis chinensis]